MVATNPINLAHINDERRKKATMEKAKAAHLSKQLQLRLQYARLKVDYGWQRQNLNEVENLYFHHSAQKGRPKPPLPRAHARPPPISYPSPVHGTPRLVDVNMFPSQKEEARAPTPLLPAAPTPAPGSSFTSQASTAETHPGPSSQASGSGSGSGGGVGAGTLPSPQTTDGTMGPPAPAEPSAPAPSADQVMLSPFAPPPHPPPAALSPSPFAPPQPPPFVPQLYTQPNPGPPPPNPGPAPGPNQPAYGAQPPAAHGQALPAAYKTFDVATAGAGGAGGGGAGAPLTYDSFWSSHSSVGGWRRHMGRGGAAATG